MTKARKLSMRRRRSSGRQSSTSIPTSPPLSCPFLHRCRSKLSRRSTRASPSPARIRGGCCRLPQIEALPAVSMSGPAVPAFRAAARFPAIRLYNHVVPVLISAAVIAATACGFISVAPNRLVSGEPVALWLAADLRVTAALAVLGAALLATAFATSNRAVHFASAGIAVSLVFLVLAAVGQAAHAQAASASKLARVSLGTAFWVMLGAAGLEV